MDTRGTAAENIATCRLAIALVDMCERRGLLTPAGARARTAYRAHLRRLERSAAARRTAKAEMMLRWVLESAGAPPCG